MPDLFYGDPIPLNRPGDFDIMKWMGGEYSEKKIAHKPPVVDPIIEKSIKAMKEKHGVKVRLHLIRQVLSLTRSSENRRCRLLLRC